MVFCMNDLSFSLLPYKVGSLTPIFKSLIYFYALGIEWILFQSIQFTWSVEDDWRCLVIHLLGFVRGSPSMKYLKSKGSCIFVCSHGPLSFLLAHYVEILASLPHLSGPSIRNGFNQIVLSGTMARHMASHSKLIDTVEWPINIDYSDQSQRQTRHWLVAWLLQFQ